MTFKLLLFTVTSVALINLVQNKLTLQKVVILNRHSLRAPLSNHLKDMTPKTWPEWNENPGILTAKGERLAGYMGSYFAAWLRNEEVLPTGCPSEDDLHVLSNSVDRTLKSAQSFVERGFPDCNIKVHLADNNDLNSLFNSVIRNNTATFKEDALKDIHDILDTINLNDAYELLSQILDYKQSKFCVIDKKCSLTKDNNYINITPGIRPQLSGPIKIGNEIVDAFLMENYEGFPEEDIAWGQLTDAHSWQTILQINRAYFNATYKTRHVAKDIAMPIIKYISEMFLDDMKPKATLLVAHDVNIHAVLSTILVRRWTLENQFEIVPIGSAVVFQKWMDDETLKNYFKLSFVYQSTEQLRNSNILSLESPPHIQTLELENCGVDECGLCPWDDFESFLGSL